MQLFWVYVRLISSSWLTQNSYAWDAWWAELFPALHSNPGCARSLIMSFCCPVVLLDLLDLVIAVSVMRTWYLCDVVDDRDVVVDCLVCVAGGLGVSGVLVISFIGLLVKLRGFCWFVCLLHPTLTRVGCLGRFMGVIAWLRRFMWLRRW